MKKKSGRPIDLTDLKFIEEAEKYGAGLGSRRQKKKG